jgi:hypothetical protein
MCPGVPEWALRLFFKHVGVALCTQLTAEPLQPTRFDRALKMLQRMHDHISHMER